MVRKTAHPLLILLLMSLLFIYEMVMMFPSETGNFSSAIINISGIGVGLFAILYSFLSIKYFKIAPPLKWCALFIIYVWLNSILHGSLPTNLAYFEVINPLFLLIAFVCAAYSSNSNYLIYIILIVYFGLDIFFITNYNFVGIIQVQNNGAYTLLFFLPFILYIPIKKIKILAIVLLCISLALSLKRGGIIAFACAISVYYFINAKHQSFTTRISRILIIILLATFAVNIILLYNENPVVDVLVERFESMEDDGGSGRSDIYEMVWDKITTDSPINLIFGYGWEAVQKNTRLGLSAHNDFLETLFDFGIIAFTLYIVLISSLIKFAFRIYKRNILAAATLGASIAITLIMSSISHIVIYPKYMLLSCMFWGFIIGKSKLSYKTT